MRTIYWSILYKVHLILDFILKGSKMQFASVFVSFCLCWLNWSLSNSTWNKLFLIPTSMNDCTSAHICSKHALEPGGTTNFVRYCQHLCVCCKYAGNSKAKTGGRKLLSNFVKLEWMPDFSFFLCVCVSYLECSLILSFCWKSTSTSEDPDLRFGHFSLLWCFIRYIGTLPLCYIRANI